MPESFPHFLRAEDSPKLPAEGFALVAEVHGTGAPNRRIVRGAYRVTAEEREALGPGLIRPRIWLLLVGATPRVQWQGRPGGEAVIFADEEAESGPVTGYFNVRLGECLGMPEKLVGTFHLFVLLGARRTEPVEVLFR